MQFRTAALLLLINTVSAPYSALNAGDTVLLDPAAYNDNLSEMACQVWPHMAARASALPVSSAHLELLTSTAPP